MKQLAKDFLKRSFNLIGLELRRKSPQRDELDLEEGNLVVPRIWNHPCFKGMIPFRLDPSRHIVLLGNPKEIEFLRSGFSRDRDVTGIEWNWDSGTELDKIPGEAQIIVCKLPVNEPQWRIIKQLRQRYGSRVTGIQELVLPFTTIQQAQWSLDYFHKTLAEIAPYYVGEKFFGPLEELNGLLPLAGKRIIEFGPMDGAQTAGLIRLGVQSVTCIEARAVSLIKTMIAQYCFGWDNLTLIMDDFHNADRQKYGRFDLAFAHGVYYHSIAPFLFFENLMSLSDNIFIGGYCTAANAASGPPSVMEYSFETLDYEGKKYSVKKIKVGNTYNSAVNQYAYHFDREDLLNFFQNRGYELAIIFDAPVSDPWGDWYLRFLARKKATA